MAGDETKRRPLGENDEGERADRPAEDAKRAKHGEDTNALVVLSLEGAEFQWSRKAVKRSVTLTECIESSVGRPRFRTIIPEKALRTLNAFAEGAPMKLADDARELVDLLHLLQGADFLHMPKAFKMLSIECCARLVSTSREKLKEELGVVCDLSEAEQMSAPKESILPEEGASHGGASLPPLLDVVENADQLIEQAIRTALSAYQTRDITTWVRGLRELEGMSKSWRAMVRNALCSRCFKPGIEEPTEMDMKPFLFVAGLGVNLVADAVARFPTLKEIHVASFKVDVAAVRSLEDTRQFRDVLGCVVGEGEPPCSLLLAAHAARYGPDGGFDVPFNAFSGSSAQKIDLPAGIISIDGYAFRDCPRLETISLPASLKSIGRGAFSSCISLNSIKFPNGLQSIGQCAFSNCASLMSIDLPATVTSIDECAFSNCNSLMTINMRATLERIGSCAFSKCSSLETINFPAGLKSIDQGAFSECFLLKTIDLPASLESIGEYAFDHCASMTSIDLPAGLKSIGQFAFSDCVKLTRIKLSKDLKSIGAHAFKSCASLMSVELPAGLKIIDQGTFSQCNSLEMINLPNCLTSIGDNAFSGCSSLTAISLPATLKSIGEQAFSMCSSLASVNLPASLESIGDHAFWKCTELASIDLPRPFTIIAASAFFQSLLPLVPMKGSSARCFVCNGNLTMRVAS